ncbi:hydroxypyruvate reductase [Pigmentiphaga litoralis]|jgi:hydroxypyruvate reductase|uniref:glycerate kinase type-2 family protein n=1 Tax=Pigmentiphaga litoralis TaxID=516702 RepID=UPI001672686E|nr:glycerate kinase [Pigmentiphaga litoralis]GGX16850.1 hydroxypyruvate reductase [Pigmentiphaga litoralis]
MQTLLLESFQAAVAAADPLCVIAAHLPPPPKGRTVVVGAGKAAASMARAVENAWPADAPLSGVVVTRYRHGLPLSRIRCLEAAHPVPDAAGQDASREILALARDLGPDDLLIALVSGGGSSLLSLPVPGVSMDDLKAVTQALLRSGAPIESMNVVRKHLSQVQGGRLVAATRAPVLGLIISDVAGDDPSAIASGPTVADPSTYADALAILARHEVDTPESVAAWLQAGAAGEHAETPKADDPLFQRVDNRMIATAQQSLQAGAAVFERAGIRTVVLGDTVTGEAREVAKVYAALVRQIVRFQQPFTAPVALISGGECTVTVKGGGRGGRCTEFLLSLAAELGDQPGMAALAADTDGIDGSEDNAGAWFDSTHLADAAARGITPQSWLDTNDAWGYFDALGTLVMTGPTLTNVNDYRVILLT